MAVRLYPDIIVAARVKDSLEDIVLICKKMGEWGRTISSKKFLKYMFP